MSFRDLLLGFINDYDMAFHQFYSQGVFPREVQQNMITLRNYVKQLALSNDSNYRVKISQGAPQWTGNPWLGIRDNRITKSFMHGVYVVYLLNRETKDLYLTLIQGATEAQYYENDNAPFTGISSRTTRETLRRLQSGAIVIRNGFGNKYLNYVTEVHCGSASYDAATVYAIKYESGDLPDDSQLESDLLTFFSIYHEYYNTFVLNPDTLEDEQLLADLQSLSWDHLPAMPKYTGKKEKKPLISIGGRKVFKRDRDVARNAMQLAGFCCEIDNSHPTFIRKHSQINYTEPHHLVPLSKNDDFNCSLDVEENVVSLCSNCHNLIHYGEGASELIKTLYNKRKNLLNSAGIDVSLETLLEYYK